MTTTEQKLKEAFSTVINVPITSDFNEVEYGKTNGWDSVAHMALVAEIESQFDIMLDTEDVIDFSSYNKGRQILAEKYNVPLA